MKRLNTYILLTVLFLVFGLYFTCWFSISIENRSGKMLESLEFENRFKHKAFRNIPSDSVITVKAFIPFDRKIHIRATTAGSIQNFLFTAENAYAGTKYNTVIIAEGISRVDP